MPSCSATLVAVVVTLLVAASSLPARPIALLLSGPETRVGVAALAPNTVRSHTTRYEFGDQEVHVSYTTTALPVPKGWRGQRCGDHFLYVSSPVAPFEVLVLGADPLPLVLFELPSTASANVENSCPFVARVGQWFLYFQGLVEQATDVAFPAVIKLSFPSP